MPSKPAPSFGLMTAPMHVDYPDVLRVWREADAIAEIEHPWLFDHLMPIDGDPGGPAYEGWTLLSALAAQTERLRLGVMVSSNRFRPPAMLAKIATVVDIVSGGRLDFGIGVGSRPDHPLARREYAAHGLPFADTADAVGSLAEALTVIRRLWTGNEPFDFHVLALGVLPDDDEVDVAGEPAGQGAADAGHEPTGAQVHVLVEDPTELQEAAPERDMVGYDLRPAHRAEVDGVVATQRLFPIRRRHVAVPLPAVRAGRDPPRSTCLSR